MAKVVSADKYSDKRSFDGQPLSKGQVLVPVWFNKEFQLANDACVHENFETWKIGGFHFLIGFAPVDRDAFSANMTLFWNGINQYMETKRSGRCIIGEQPDGTPIVCPKSNRCTGCPKRNTLPRYNPKKDAAEVLSLDFLYDDETFDIADPSALNPEDAVIMADLEAELMNHLESIKPRYKVIAQLSRAGFDDDEIIARIGLKKSRGYEEINMAFELSVKFLTRN